MAAPAPALFTYAEVAAHNTKKDLYVVIHDNVYNASSFVDEHPCVFPPFPVLLLAANGETKAAAGSNANGMLT